MGFSISKISRSDAELLVNSHHYTGKQDIKRKLPGIKFAFGLYEDEELCGCVIYSIPASYTLCRGVCGLEYSKSVLELSRLVITTETKNAASWLIGASLRELSKLGNWVLVSYADCNDHVGHVGYIYQATNWVYTGQGTAEPAWVDPRDGKVLSYTRRHIDVKARAIGLEVSQLEKQPQKGKHRYINWAGQRSFVKKAKQDLKYTEKPYPKGPTRRH